ncbi:MAG: S-layer homology domain-containing protein [Xenococcaceae cyanobacterium MO_167.B27]|nr:S-layer homology domain-containing protein [Xenococcaceae cyanobacterium MO_167.B27]
MLNKTSSSNIFSSAILTGLLLFLAGCNNGEAIQSFLSPNPQLSNSQDNTTSNSVAPVSENNNSSDQDNFIATEVKQSQTSSNKQESYSIEDLPATFPPEIPLYPEAILEALESEGEAGTSFWRSPDDLQSIVNYYQEQFNQDNWSIVQPFSNNLEQKHQTIISSKNNLKVKVSVLPKSETETLPTKIVIAYRPFDDSLEEDLSETNNDATATSTVEPGDIDTSAIAQTDFSDLDQVPEQLRQAVQQVAALDILTPYLQEGQITKFAPNEPITRRDYARWLVAANNTYYGQSPGKKIRLGTPGSQLAFKDIEPNDPDFAAIQGLAEAGLIPSVLTQENDNLLFQPDAPLTREDLLAWKVPLDIRKALPKASMENIKESWGFQDTTNISTPSLRALLADFENGDRSNVRRIFGYTTLFQPKKPVTRGEAAASLWYFGFQGDGITAKEALKIKSNDN